MKRSLSCSVDSSTIGSPLNSPKCVTSLNNSKQFTEFSSSSAFSASLLSPSSSSTEMMVSAHHSTTYSSSPIPASNSYMSLTSAALNSPSTVFSSCMFPEIPAFSPGDSALSGCGNAHVPASGPAYVDCGAASGAELAPVGVNEAGGVAETGEGCGSMTSTTIKRSLSRNFSEDDVITSCPSKRTCTDSYQQKVQRSKGLMLFQTYRLFIMESFHCI